MGEDVDTNQLAAETKNYTGADLESLVHLASATAMRRLIKYEGDIIIQPRGAHDFFFIYPEDANNLCVKHVDFIHAIGKNTKQKYGLNADESNCYLNNEIINYGKPIEDILSKASLLINLARTSKMNVPVTLLLEGIEGCGKTTMAAHIAYKLSKFSYITFCSPENMIGFSESAKCQALKKIFDNASKSISSCIIIDDIERILEYVPFSAKISTPILQTFIVLLRRHLKPERKLLIIATTSITRDILNQLQLLSCFNDIINVPPISNVESLVNVLQELQRKSNGENDLQFTDDQILDIEMKASSIKKIRISVKRLTSLYEMVSGEGNSKHVDNFMCWLENDMD